MPVSVHLDNGIVGNAIPMHTCLEAIAHALARYAALATQSAHAK